MRQAKISRIKLAVVSLVFLMSYKIIGAEQGNGRMSLEAHSALIQKLESVLDFKNESVSQNSMYIRLADLYSERARLYALENEGRGDFDNKKKIQSDRNKAISFYDRAFKNAPNDQKGAILLQTAHLHNLNGNKKKSESIFKNIVSQKNHTLTLKSQAELELGDIEYNRGQFKKAKVHFKNALKDTQLQRKSYAQYRIAWCDFHEGNSQSAILQMKDLLTNSKSFLKQDGTLDTSFQEEASRDLATFIARRDLRNGDIEDVLKLSPENVKIQNLTYLATELDRTGKKISALKVWDVIGHQNRSFDTQLEGQIKVTQIQYDLGKKPQTVVELKKSIEMFKKEKCEDKSLCDTFQKQIRKIVTDWGKAEQITPSTEVIQAYQVYAFEFEDIEIAYWGAQAAQKRKQHIEAFNLYSRSAQVAKNQLNKKGDAQTRTLFEGALLGAIDSAEQSNQAEIKQKAYDQYLSLNPNGDKALEVEYQIAYLNYENKNFEIAADKFKKVAYSNKNGADLKNKSADLAIDSLVLLKQDSKIEIWASDFGALFPKRKNEFLTIQRKAILNQAALVINNSEASNSELESQYKKLSNSNMSGSTTEERASFAKHRMLIATKTKNIDSVISTAQFILKIPNVKRQEKEEALKTLAWAYEMKLDFKNAYNTQKRITPVKKEDHELKLAVLAELAKLNAIPHYEIFLKLTKNNQQKQEAAFSIIRLSKNKTGAFNKHKKLLRTNPKLFVAAGLFAYEEKKSNKLRSELLAQRGARNSFEYILLQREQATEQILKEEDALKKMKISNQNLNSSLQKRVRALTKFERTAQAALESKDFTLQLLALAVVSKENSRLVSDIRKLPVPKGLKANQRKEYQDLLAQQILPYQEKSKKAQESFVSLWDMRESTNFEEIVNLSFQKNRPGVLLAKNEVNQVKKVANRMGLPGKDVAKNWQQRQKLSQRSEELKKLINKNPFDSSYLEEFKEIQNKINPGPMVAYLNSRLKTDGGVQ